MKQDIKEVMAMANNGPFRYWPECCRDGGMVTSKGGGHICAPTPYESAPEITKNHGLLIAHCLNEFPKLLMTLKRTLGMIESDQHPADIERFITAAIKSASNVEVS